MTCDWWAEDGWKPDCYWTPNSVVQNPDDPHVDTGDTLNQGDTADPTPTLADATSSTKAARVIANDDDHGADADAYGKHGDKRHKHKGKGNHHGKGKHHHKGGKRR